MNALMLILLLSGIADRARHAPTSQPAVAAPRASAELTDAEVRDQVAAFLSTIDVPIRFAQWKALGPRATALLEETAFNAEQMPTRRAKALEGLSALPGAATTDQLLGLARSETEPPLVRMTAMRGAARLLPSAKILSTLRPFLTASADPRLRSTAADAIANHVPAQGCREVKAQAAREKEELRPHFTEALDRCNKL